MSYSIIQPPFTLKFREMSADELRGYRRWFLETMPSRLIELQNTVNSDSAFSTWKPDYNPASIQGLGLWLSGQIETRPRTAEELDQINAKPTFHIEVSTRELTNKTFSLAMDSGMYFGETFRTQYPHLKWDQPLKNRKYADFGQMVLAGFNRVELNPVRIVVTFCYGIASGRRTAKRFDEVYEYWSRLADEAKGTAKAR